MKHLMLSIALGLALALAWALAQPPTLHTTSAPVEKQGKYCHATSAPVAWQWLR